MTANQLWDLMLFFHGTICAVAVIYGLQGR